MRILGSGAAASVLGPSSGSNMLRFGRPVIANLKQLTSLTALGLLGCSQMEELPDTFHHIPHLAVLSLSGCTALRALPKGIYKSKELRQLDLQDCRSLSCLPRKRQCNTTTSPLIKQQKEARR